MKRRDFIRYAAVTLSTLTTSRLAGGQRLNSLVRGAVVIGINKAGHLPRLSAATSGAEEIAKWLAAEEFEVKLFTDNATPVKISAIFESINGFVKKSNLDQLVIYFSGHGFLNRYAEHWLLSEAFDHASEAINLYENRFLATLCGIPNVVFISDACRSIPQTFDGSLITGSSIFPTPRSPGPVGYVDILYATAPGAPAYELPIAQSVSQYEGIFTTCLLDAFKRPDQEMVVPLPSGIRVVPNRRLEKFLAREVQSLAQAKSIRLTQFPHAEVNSPDTAYMGSVHAPAVASTSPRTATIQAVARAAIQEVFEPPKYSTESYYDDYKENLDDLANTSGFRRSQYSILQTIPQARSFETQTGISINGFLASYASANRSLVTRDPEIVGGGRLVRVDLALGIDACTVLVRFNNLLGAAIPALRGFISDITFSAEGITNISFIPSQNSNRWVDYAGRSGQLHELRAAVATAVEYGVFQIEGFAGGGEDARFFADRIRILKGIDPTLGVYAAYAYAQASAIDQLNSVQAVMQSDLNVNLYDVALLARNPTRSGQIENVVPFCPLLSQGWSLLRVKNVDLPASATFASRYMRQALWTTFYGPGVQALESGLASGELK